MTLLDDTERAGGDAPSAGRTRRLRTRTVVLAVLTALVVTVAGVTALSRRSSGTGSGPATGPVTEAVMEDRYGVRIDLVALTALGGLLQLRFTVLDKDKAEKLFHADKPNLLVESTGTVLSPPTDAAHKMVLVNGAGYFLFYANADDVVHEGDKVSVAIDGVRLLHLVVKA